MLTICVDINAMRIRNLTPILFSLPNKNHLMELNFLETRESNNSFGVEKVNLSHLEPTRQCVHMLLAIDSTSATMETMHI